MIKKTKRKSHPQSSKSRTRISNTAKQNWANPEIRKKTVEAQILANSDSRVLENKSRIAKELWSHPEYRENVILSMKKTINTPCGLKLKSDTTKALWKNPEWTGKRQLSLHKITRPEQSVLSILDLVCPNEFKYNGRYDCGVTIDGLVPDFINVNGQKKIIDVHGEYYHKDEDTRIRKHRYAKCGYKALILWEHDIKHNPKVVLKIQEFVEKC